MIIEFENKEKAEWFFEDSFDIGCNEFCNKYVKPEYRPFANAK